MTIPKSKIAPEGINLILILSLLAWFTALLDLEILSLVIGALAIFTVYFFRDPERKTPDDPRAVVAPADGTVIEIGTAFEENFLNREMLRLSIFLSITDCHINRFPVEGRVKATRYLPGKFKRAYLDVASRENERITTLIETEEGEQVVMVQVAGLIARRIVSYLNIGDRVRMGERFGMIKFGSRVDLYVPPGYELTAVVGQKVRGGETIIGRVKKEGTSDADR